MNMQASLENAPVGTLHTIFTRDSTMRACLARTSYRNSIFPSICHNPVPNHAQMR